MLLEACRPCRNGDDDDDDDDDNIGGNEEDTPDEPLHTGELTLLETSGDEVDDNADDVMIEEDKEGGFSGR